MAYFVPDHSFEFEPKDISEGDMQAIKAILQDKQIEGEIEKVFVSRIDFSYYIVVQSALPTTVHITVETLISKQLELGMYD